MADLKCDDTWVSHSAAMPTDIDDMPEGALIFTDERDPLCSDDVRFVPTGKTYPDGYPIHNVELQ